MRSRPLPANPGSVRPGINLPRQAAHGPVLALILAAFCTLPVALPVMAQDAPAPAATTASTVSTPAPVRNSSMDGQLFYQVLISELRARQEPGYAYQVYLQLGKQHKSAQLFQRSVEIALNARAGEQALNAAKAWHQTLPQDRQATEYTAQILLALARPQAMVEPLRNLIEQTPSAQQPQALLGLSRSLSRLTDRAAVAKLIDEVTVPWRTPGGTDMSEAWAVSADAWLSAGEHDKAYAYLQHAQSLSPNALHVGLLAAEMMTSLPQAEAIVKQQLSSQSSPQLQLAYARRLLLLQRTADALPPLEQVVQAQPDNALAWLSLGTARMDLNQLDEAEQATLRFVELALASRAQPSTSPSADQPAAENSGMLLWDPSLGYLKLAQISERRNRLDQAEQWLQKADPKGEKMNVQVIRAKLVAAQGRMPQARQLLQAIVETEPRDALVKLTIEAQLLKDNGFLEEGYTVLQGALQRFPDEPDVLYDIGMMADQMGRFDTAEQHFRKLIEVKPDHPNAYNALGYSLADRGVRLDDARVLLTKALAMRPNDPYIIDSMGWLAFRQGRLEEALALLQQAYASKPDTEVAAHLGEVLWVMDRKDEARTIWRQARERDADNAVLKQTIERLKVDL